MRIRRRRSDLPIVAGHMPLARRLRRLTVPEIIREATEFLHLYFREQGEGPDLARIAEVKRQIRQTGTYTHSFEELEFGARVAWRNHARCIGRLYWRSLKVIDKRDVTDPDGVIEHVTAHMRSAINNGKIQSTMTVFAPARPGGLPTHIESAQITQYAGYAKARAQTVGDRKTVEATRIAQSDGWTGTNGPFDVLPVALITEGGQRVHRDVPLDANPRIAITHEGFPDLATMALEWYALPVISNMIMTIGGVDYPCAPFNGFYMATEIASRNLVDPWRYDLLEDIATAFGFAPSDTDPYWRDRTVTELNAAVAQSYARAGVQLLDHHSAAKQFMEFRSREKLAGRNVHADWSWIVPPQSSSITQPFHLSLENENAVPNFYHSSASDGRYLMPYLGDQHRSRLQNRFDHWQRRYTRWRRRPR